MNEQSKNSNMKIFTQKQASYLMFKGFKCLGTIDNKDKAGFKIFLFKKSEKLLKAMEQYKTNKNKLEEFIKGV